MGCLENREESSCSMGNTGSRVSDNGERTDSDEKLKEDDVKMENDNQDSEPIEDYMMSEVSSLRDNFEEEGNGFHVGDIVWGEEVNSQQWWPCQIYDSSDASDLALKTMQKGKILVAYFGANERSFAWCNPLQLKPFLEKFSEFSKMTQSRGFLCAVEEAVREIGEAVEQFLVCDETALVSNVAVNSGIKEGVLVPSLRREIVSSLVLENPGFDLENIKRLAKMVSVSDLLEIEVLKRNISAFYRCKGRFDLAKYDEDMFILGLEDKEDDESYKRLLRKCSRENMKCGNEVDKVNLGDVVTTTSLRKTRSDVSKSLSPRTRKRKNKTGLGDDGIERREKSNHLEESEKKDNSGETLSLEMGNRNGGETILQNGKRERKRSKYLSPEYVTDFSCRARKGKILESDESSKIQVEKAIKEATSEEMLDLIREVALNKTYAEDNDMVREYVSMYRSFTYHDESNNKIHKDEEKYSGVELVIKTGLGSCALPSKEDLMELYKKFGALDKERSCVLENDSCAHIAFLNVPDGEEAFKKSLEICPFATASTVTFELKYNPSLEKLKDIERREGVMEIECLKEKLEEMRSLIDESHGEITKELKMKLEDGSRNLLERVRKITVRSS